MTSDIFRRTSCRSNAKSHSPREVVNKLNIVLGTISRTFMANVSAFLCVPVVSTARSKIDQESVGSGYGLIQGRDRLQPWKRSSENLHHTQLLYEQMLNIRLARFA